ncbi:MAG: response regulator [Spirochaetaceae bacterium]|jgi:chemosensory pili system protein ChpA (sensor histidine kinase/response regulator)|nr:response regulator [Spirochaetaceae bacterium]
MMADGAKKVVLAVDDMSEVLISINEILGDIYDVRLIKKAALALDMLNKEKVDLVLLDIEMPEMSGVDILRNIRNNRALKKLPVMFITSNTNRLIVQQAVNLGISGYIGKPFATDTLRAKVAEVLEAAQ